jgi:Protein of unknown function (DUF3717)
MMNVLTIGQLEQAINRARSAQPAHGIESALSPDVAALASLYGRMIFLRLEACPTDALEPREREAIARWGGSPLASG